MWALDAGLDKTLSGEEMVNRSARRVGLEVPEMYAEKQDKEEAVAKYLADKRAKEAATRQ